jgi:magnesium-protoporphyrin IX monomethyl ester (oxidative) cyclase
VFLTHSLTVCERDGFYGLLGIDAAAFDAEVMRQTNRTARRAFPWVFDLENSDYLLLRDHLIATYRALRAGGSAPLSRLGLRLRFAGLLLLQFCQPMLDSSQTTAGGVA